MKFKATKKEIANGYTKVIAIGYCGVQHLLYCESPIAYTVSGGSWGADVYQFGSVAIATGYSPFGNVRPGYDKVSEYDHRAAEIISRTPYDYQTVKAELGTLIQQFIADVTAD